MTNKKGSKWRRYLKSLMRLLSKPKDMYVHAMTTCSSHVPYVEATMGFPTPTLPRSFSVRSTTRSSARDNDDLKHLLRSGSVRSSHRDRVESERCRKPPAAAARPPRLCTVGIGRIDEDKPCEFGYDIHVKPQICPLSRSYAVRGRGARVF